MNERYQELVRLAVEDAAKYSKRRFDISVEENETFALCLTELIVKECASLMVFVKEYYSRPGTYESREYYERMSAKEDAFDDAAHMIKTHFGVKE